ncbi:Pre-mRNA-splicing factor syf1 like protein [Argiope bruennichi]|nr:Pre-mRNA-splicing factor syf1 like protein [Argiope bruennichi]
MNIKENRKLVENFFISAEKVLQEKGNIIVTLCRKQGGTGAEVMPRLFENSWKIVNLAASAGLILCDIEFFNSQLYNSYKCTGYRGLSKKFDTDGAVTHFFCRGQAVLMPADKSGIHNLSNKKNFIHDIKYVFECLTRKASSPYSKIVSVIDDVASSSFISLQKIFINNNQKNVVVEDEDIPYEEEILRNPYSVKHWLRYIEFKKEAPKHVINLLYERALRELPGSYIIWHKYLKLRRAQIRGKCVTDPAYEDVNSAFERALVFMHKMPRIWIDYCEFLSIQCQITRTRHVFDRALRALPITQHHRIWPLYLKFVSSKGIPETAVRVYRRYLKLCSEDTEDFIEYLLEINRLDEAAVKLAEIVNNEQFVSKHGKPKHQLWNELCELISKNPDEVHSLNVDAIIRDGLRRFSDQVGHFWNCLADYYIRSGLFDRARDIYEEAITTVMTVRDFTQVFDAYSQCEESLIKAKIEKVERGGATEEGAIINTYTEAVQKVDPKLACGKLHTLWVAFAKFYESHKQIDDASLIFEKATQVPYTEVDDLASVWCEWAEMEIRHKSEKTNEKELEKCSNNNPEKLIGDSGLALWLAALVTIMVILMGTIMAWDLPILMAAWTGDIMDMEASETMDMDCRATIDKAAFIIT